MKNLPRIPAVLLLSMFLFGCGQSGPLYVSGNPSNVDPATEQSASEEDEQDAEESENE